MLLSKTTEGFNVIRNSSLNQMPIKKQESISARSEMENSTNFYLKRKSAINKKSIIMEKNNKNKENVIIEFKKRFNYEKLCLRPNSEEKG